jgi:hypothetical protein
LVASAAIPSTALTGAFVYQAIAPVSLASGQVYTIGQLLIAPPGFNVLVFPIGLTTPPEITFIGGASAAQATLVEPSPNPNTSYFGPNFQFTTSSGPEPGSSVLLGFALLAVLLGFRQKQRSMVGKGYFHLAIAGRESAKTSIQH